METTDLIEQSNSEKPLLILNEDARYFLHQSGKWAGFLGILGFILTGFIVLIALFMGSVLSMLPKYQATPYSAGLGGVMGFIYLPIAVLYFFFSLYLYQFSTQIKDGILFNNETQVSAALGKLKSFFKLWGVTTIVVIALYILIIIGIIIAIPLMHHAAASNTVTFAQ